MESHLEPAGDQDQVPGAVAISPTSNRPGAPSQLGEAEQGSPDAKRGAGEASGTRAAVLGATPTTAQGELEPGVGGDPLGVPQPRGREGQPATGEERATEPPQRAQGFSGGRGRPDRILAEEPPGKGRPLAEGGRSAQGEAGRRRGRGGLPLGPWRQPEERLPSGDPGGRAPPKPLAQKREKRERDHCGGECLCR